MNRRCNSYEEAIEALADLEETGHQFHIMHISDRFGHECWLVVPVEDLVFV